MNRGNIPGFYYDETKKKYFKIQADHLVPEGVKYSKGQVKQEKRSSKKRKVENDRRIQREKNTIKAAPVLKSAVIAGIGLHREHAIYPSKHLIERDNAVISQCMFPKRVEIKFPDRSKDTRLQIAQYVPELEHMVFASSGALSGKSVLYSGKHQWSTGIESKQINHLETQDLAAFNSSIGCVSATTAGGVPRVLACASTYQSRNVFLGTLPIDDSWAAGPPGVYLSVGVPMSSISDSAMHPNTGSAAVIGSCGMYIIDRHANVSNSHRKNPGVTDWPRCEPCISWLNPNTVLYGAKPHFGHSVMLWDVRTPDGRAPRFNIRERLTGVFNPTKYGHNGSGDEHQILASTNHRIDLFDTRMPGGSKMQDTPVMSFSHTHGGPRLQRAAYGRLVAAVDAGNIVQIYSIRTGEKVKSLKAMEWKPKRLESPVLHQLMWYEDPWAGPTLQAIRGNGVLRWTWGGPGLDDNDSSDEEL